MQKGNKLYLKHTDKWFNLIFFHFKMLKIKTANYHAKYH